MKPRTVFPVAILLFMSAIAAVAAPTIDPLGDVTIPAGKSLIIPVTATSPNGRPLTFTATSSTNGIAVEVHTNDPFWKMSVVQAAPANAPGAFQTPFRSGTETVTNVGDMTFMLFPEYAPHSVKVIEGLTDSGFYNSNTIFHRVISGFMIQGGDPQTNGTGGPVFRYDDEFNPQAIFSGRGQLALANSGKDTDGSQFFVTVAPYRYGDFNYTIFGQLVRGFSVLSNINNTATDTNSRPLADVIITHAGLVPDTSDTVLTLTATNRNGVSSLIKVVADDGAGERATNTFTATVLTDTNSNSQPLIDGTSLTNLIAPVNVTLTNVLNATELDGKALYWFPEFADQSSYNAASNSTYVVSNSLLKTLTYNVTNTQGQIRFFLEPVTDYSGPVTVYLIVSSNPQWNFYQQYGLSLPPYDLQKCTFVFGDTPISAQATNFTVPPLTGFTNQLLATFTNGVPGSDTTNFMASINWGDNVTNNGIILTNNNGTKEVFGSHDFTNGGTYPVSVTIQSVLGASATVVSTASVPPSLSIQSAGTNNVIAWPAWATDYQLQSATTLTNPHWLAVTNFPRLAGYASVVTNHLTDSAAFFQLMK